MIETVPKCSRCRGHRDREARLCSSCAQNRKAYYASHKEQELSTTRRTEAARRAYVKEQKIGRPCAMCGMVAGIDLPVECFDFDHLPGTEKKFNLAVPCTRSKRTIDAEIAKCQVLCANDHAITTRLRADRQDKAYGRERFISSLKGNTCSDCRRRLPSESLHFDHARGDKEFNLGAPSGRSTPEILTEIDKCDVVCACCHRVRTKLRGQSC